MIPLVFSFDISSTSADKVQSCLTEVVRLMSTITQIDLEQ